MVDLRNVNGFRALGVTALALMAGACAHVSQDDFQAEVADIRAELRAEMQAGDEAVESRLSGRMDEMAQQMSRLESQLRSLEEELDVQVERLETSLRVHTPVHFGFDSAELDQDGREVLDRLAGVLNEYYPTAMITVEGFTDPAGSQAYNLQLGQRRADAVRGWLVTDGLLPESQVRAVSYGEDTSRLVRPGEAGPGLTGRENRRVVVVIDHPGAEARPIVTDGNG